MSLKRQVFFFFKEILSFFKEKYYIYNLDLNKGIRNKLVKLNINENKIYDFTFFAIEFSNWEKSIKSSIHNKYYFLL